jgi:hypothetical protein
MSWYQGTHESVPVDSPLFSQPPKISRATKAAATSPLGLFMHIMSPSFWDNVTEQTNLFKAQSPPVATSRKDSRYLKPSYLFSRNEILKYLALCMEHMLHKPVNGMAPHWQTTGGTSLRQAGTFMSVMPRDKFRAIGRFLHFDDNSDTSPERCGDKFRKISLVIEELQRSFKLCMTLGPFISFDEALLAYKGRWCRGKTYNPMKPHKWGVKLFVACDSESGYVHQFEFYGGKARFTDSLEMVDRLQDTTTGPAALLRNMKEYAGSFRAVFCDR